MSRIDEIRARRSRSWLAGLLAAVSILAGCGGSSEPIAGPTPITAMGDTPGATPFIHLIQLRGSDTGSLASVNYVIEPKPTAASAAVSVTYGLPYLSGHGYVAADGTVTVPVFGLYAGYQNTVDFSLRFNDGTTRAFSVPVATDAWVDPNGVYDHGVVLQPRAKGSALGFDYFLVKSAIAGPLIMDTDGEVRWVGPGWVVANAISSTFTDNGIVVGSSTSKQLTRFELDGTYTQESLQFGPGTTFHHNLDPGKTGLFGDINSVTYPESLLVEFDPAGVTTDSWDLSAIVSAYMLQNGDDPTLFVRSDADWFHMNSAVYDPSDDSVIVSSRENFVIKLDYATGTIKWILGDPTKYWYTFPSLRAKALTLAAGGLYPIGQHAVTFTSDGLLMLFNDGMASLNQPAGAPAGETRTYSAVSAYSIDAAAMTAQEVWRFDYGQTIYSPACSSAYEAADKSILVDYATASNSTQARLVGLDASHAVAFDFQFPSPGNCVTAWNSVPVPLQGLSF